jgi:hypothetical protein
MLVEVCTVFAPRPEHPQWRDYLPLLRAQRASVVRLGHTHTVITDSDLGPDFDQLRVDLPHELMPAMIEGILRRLDRPVDSHICFVDADCLVERPLRSVFERSVEFDIGLTYRANDVSPINNGVMYMPKQGHAGSIMFFREALRRCGTHWGADQEAISKAAAPVPQEQCYGERSGATVRFLNPKSYAAVPKVRLAKHDAFVVHFKGATKDWMIDYAREYHGYQTEAA